jgi:hypothetical protein
VFIPKTTTSYRTTQLRIPSNTDLLLYGTLFALAGLNNAYVISNNTSNIIIQGYGTIDANGPAQTFTGSPLAGVGFYTTTNVRISGITITNAFHWPITVNGGSNVVLDGITLTKGGAANQFTAGCSDCWIVNSEIDGTGNGDYAWAFYAGVTNSGAIGNVVKNAGAGTGSSPPGIGILSDGAAPDPASVACRDILIANNICHDNNGPGISILNVATPTGGLQTGIVISNNRCYNNCKLGYVSGNVGDIYVDQSTGVTISGNNVSGSGNSAGQFGGIFLGPTVSHVGIFGNHIYNIGRGRTDNVGILSYGANDVFVSGNYVYDSQTTHTMSSFMGGAVGARNVFLENSSDLPNTLTLPSDTLVAGPAFGGGWKVTGATTLTGTTLIGGNNIFQVGTGGDSVRITPAPAGVDPTILAVGTGNINLQVGGQGTGRVILMSQLRHNSLPIDALDDAAAAGAGVQVGEEYRNGSIKMIRAG